MPFLDLRKLQELEELNISFWINNQADFMKWEWIEEEDGTKYLRLCLRDEGYITFEKNSKEYQIIQDTLEHLANIAKETLKLKIFVNPKVIVTNEFKKIEVYKEAPTLAMIKENNEIIAKNKAANEELHNNSIFSLIAENVGNTFEVQKDGTVIIHKKERD